MVTLTASINDAPKDDLDMEDDVYSPERLRAYEEAQSRSDHTVYRVIAREKHNRLPVVEHGQLVGLVTRADVLAALVED